MHIDTVNIHIGLPAVSAIPGIDFASLLAFADSPASEPKPGSLTPPQFGEYWVGQGGLYVGVRRGFHTKKPIHLILPTDPRAIFEGVSLGTYDVDVTGATSDCDGLANTQALAKAGSKLCQAALDLEIEGHKDFFLMSRFDARLCHMNLPEQFEKAWYLTSTQASRSYAWFQDFTNGDQDNYHLSFEARAMFVRRLVL